MTFGGNYFPTIHPEVQLAGTPDSLLIGEVRGVPLDNIIAFYWLADQVDSLLSASFTFSGSESGMPRTVTTISISAEPLTTWTRGLGFTETDDLVAYIGTAGGEGRPHISLSGTIPVAGSHRYFSDPLDPADMVTDYEFDWSISVGTALSGSPPKTYQWWDGGLENHGLVVYCGVQFKYKRAGVAGPTTAIYTDHGTFNPNPSRGFYAMISSDPLNPIAIGGDFRYYAPIADGGTNEMNIHDIIMTSEVTSNLAIST